MTFDAFELQFLKKQCYFVMSNLNTVDVQNDLRGRKRCYTERIAKIRALAQKLELLEAKLEVKT